MIKAILFDIDDTLYSYKAAHEVAFARVCAYAEEALGIPPEELKGVTAVEIGERVHRMMADDLGPDLVAE